MKQPAKRYVSGIVAINLTLLGCYVAFGAGPAPGGAIICAVVIALAAWTSCVFTWRRSTSADWLDVVEVVMELEAKFQIDVPDEDYQKFRTVDDAYKYFERRRAGRD